MSPIERRLRAAVNPLSTAATRWWCHSAMRHLLTGYGPARRQRRLIRQGPAPRPARAAAPGRPVHLPARVEFRVPGDSGKTPER
jgi:hypothetical protein